MTSSADTADFFMRLHEEVNAPARRAREGVQQLSGGLVVAQKELQRTERALASFYKKEAEEPARAARLAAERRHETIRRGVGSLVGGAGGALFGGEVGEIAGALAGGHGGGLLGAGFGIATAAIGETINLAKEAVGAFAEMTKGIGEAAYEGLKFGQNMRLAFGYLVHDKALGKETFDAVRHEAQALALNVDETTNSFRSLLAAQFSIEQSHALVKMAADMKAIGASDEEVQRVLYAMREIKDLGNLQQRQLRQLEMAGISGSLIEKHLELRFKTTSPKQLADMRKKGQLSADLAIEAIKDAVKEKTGEANLGDVAATMGANTISGMLNKGRAIVSNYFIDLGERLEPAATRIAGKLFSVFDGEMAGSSIKGFADYAVLTLQELEQWIDNHWDAIKAFAHDSVEDIIDGSKAVYDWVKGSASFVIAHWDDIKAAGQELETNVWNLVAPFVIVTQAIRDFLQWWDKLFAASDAAGDAIGKFIGLDTQFGKNVLGYESNAARKNREQGYSPEGEKEALEANRARTLMIRQSLGIEAGSAAATQQAAQARGITIGSISMPIEINGADHHDTGSLTDDIDNRIRKNFTKLMESLS